MGSLADAPGPLERSDDETGFDGEKIKAGYSIQGDEGTFQSGAHRIPIGDNWDELLREFSLDPEHFYVVDDTVRMSRWQQSARTKDGDRDVVTLYSYRGLFRRKTAGQIEMQDSVESAVERLRKRSFKPLIRRTVGKGLSAPCAYAHAQGDEQGGKSEGGGIPGLLEREEATLENSLRQLKRLLAKGYDVTSIVDLATGDKMENIFGHYESQPRTTATLRAQEAYAVDSDLARTEAFATFGIPLRKIYTPSNHGEQRRKVGVDPPTSASDNLDLIVAENVKRVVDRLPIADQVTWHIPHDAWMTTIDVGGLGVGLSHGHKIKGKPEDWAVKQRDYFRHHHDVRLDIIVIGHRHHGFIRDIGGSWLIQTPSLDGGSPYFEAAFGTRAQHGALSFLIGQHHPFGWSDLTGI